MPGTQREHEAFCTIDRYGLVTTHDTLEDAVLASDPEHGRHLYVGHFKPYTSRRLTLRQYRAALIGGVLCGSVLLDVVENWVRWQLWGHPTLVP